MGNNVKAAGVYAVYDYVFKIGPAGATPNQLMTVKDVNSLQPKVKGTVKNWVPLDQKGWERNLITGKSMSFDMKGERNVGDPGNDFIAGKLLATGQDCNAVLQITFPNGDILTCNGVIDISTPFGGASTDVDTLEWTYTVDGKPTYTLAGASTPLTLSNSSPAAGATGVADNDAPVLTFSNPIADYAGISIISTKDGSLVAFTGALDAAEKILTLTPAAAFSATSTYEIIISDVKDIYGQTMATQIVKFTTA